MNGLLCGMSVVCAGVLFAGAETLTLEGGTKTLDGELSVSGITFLGETASEIVAPLGVYTPASPAAVPSSEFSDIYGVSLLSPDGTLPGTIDASGWGIAGGKVSTGLSDLVFDTVDKCVSGTREYSASAYLPSWDGGAVTYWKNRNLADIKSVHAIIKYGYKMYYGNVARTCFFTNDGQTATMQFQSRMSIECNSGLRNLLVGTCVTLTQSGSDILAKVTTGGYVDTTKGISPFFGECVDFTQAIPAAVGGKNYYYVGCLLAGEEGTNGGKGIAVKTAGFEKVCDDTVELGTDATSPVVYWENLSLADITGMDAELYAHGELSSSKQWEPAGGYFFERPDSTTLRVTFQRLAGAYKEQIGGAWVVLGDDYVASSTVEFKQVGNDVTAQGISSGYRYLHIEYPPHQSGVASLPLPTSLLRVATYPVRKLTVFVKPKADVGGPLDVAGGIRLSGGGTLKVSSPASGFSRIMGSGSVAYASDLAWMPPLSNTLYGVTANSYDGQTTFDGGYHVITKSGVIPAGGRVILTNGATVVTRSSDTAMSLCSGGRYEIYAGGILRIEKGKSLDDAASVRLFGGSLYVNTQQCFLDDVTLSDGATVDGNAAAGFRFGFQPAYPWIYSTGSQSNRITSCIRLYRPKGGTGFGTFYTAADLLLTGKVMTSGDDAGYEASLIKKRGAGRLILTSTCYNPDDSFANTVRVEVVEGTLRNESANALRDVNSVELHSGTSYEAVTAAHALGRLVVDGKRDWESDCATLRFENGGSLALPADGLDIASGALLVLDGEVMATSFRVGTSACVAKEVLARIRQWRNGRLMRVYQDSAGGIHAAPGFVMLVR